MKPAGALEATVARLLAAGKGILAADESLTTIGTRFKALGIASTEESRRNYRELLCTTPALNEFISGVILFEDTLRQSTRENIPLPEILNRQGIVPGIKVDRGTSALANFTGETITQGLDGLRERLIEYRALGARFTKWRAVIRLDENLPTRTCILANASALASFAALSQEAGLVPIVEPEVLMNGNHSLLRCESVTLAMLQAVFSALLTQRVVLEQMLLKTSMVLAGAACPDQADLEAVTQATVRCLRRVVPAAVPGILFLSGGQKDLVATQRLNALCNAGSVPWKLTFSFGRALQSAAMSTWKGAPENITAAQEALYHRAKCNSLAVRGEYSEVSERAVLAA